MKRPELQERTLDLGRRVVALVNSLPRTPSGRVIGNQILRSGTSVGANYRAAGRSRSRREFVSKLGIALEEADETIYWLEPLIATDLVPRSRLESLIREVRELVAILVASIKTARRATPQR